MSDGHDRDGQSEFQFSNAPDFNQMMAQRLAGATKSTESKPTTGFDPYKVMVQKKEMESGNVLPDISSIVRWPEADVKVLEDFCKKYGVLGFDCGKMSPIAALTMLKNMLGIVDGPLENRIPSGYEKMGVKSNYSPNYPYQSVFQKKDILHG